MLGFHLVQYRRIGKVETSFSIGHPNAQGRSDHVLEDDRRTVGLNLDIDKATFKFATFVVQQARLLRFFCDCVVEGRYPSQERHELTAIANTQTERIGSMAELFKLLQEMGIEFVHTRPSLTTIQDVGKRNPPTKTNARN